MNSIDDMQLYALAEVREGVTGVADTWSNVNLDLFHRGVGYPLPQWIAGQPQVIGSIIESAYVRQEHFEEILKSSNVVFDRLQRDSIVQECQAIQTHFIQKMLHTPVSDEEEGQAQHAYGEGTDVRFVRSMVLTMVFLPTLDRRVFGPLSQLQLEHPTDISGALVTSLRHRQLLIEATQVQMPVVSGMLVNYVLSLSDHIESRSGMLLCTRDLLSPDERTSRASVFLETFLSTLVARFGQQEEDM